MIRDILGKLLFSLSKKLFMGKIVGLVSNYFPLILPVSHIKRTRKTIVFFHPKPSYADHILLVPRKIIPDFDSLIIENLDFLVDIVDNALILIESRAMGDEYSLCVNIGEYQEVQQVHFHLYRKGNTDPVFPASHFSDQTHKIYKANYYTSWKTHWVFTPKRLSSRSLVQLSRFIGKSCSKACTIYIQLDNSIEGITFHLTSGS